SERLTKIIEPIVSGLGYECVGVEFVPHAKQSVLRVFIDSENGVLVDDCAKVSHQLSGALDVEDPIPGNYQLEISSPGIERPLFKLADFDRFKAQTAEIELYEALHARRKYRGYLEGTREQAIILEVDGTIHEIPFDLIKKARLSPEVFGVKQGKRNGK
ncbi:MAG: ribosome maturation factor RimP, partial [Methylococcales bacterium]